jgi:type I restriction enzyme M protein
LKRDYDLTERLKILQELVFASTGESMFNEVFKLIYAKIHDEIEARDRKDNELKFRVYFDDQQVKDEASILFEEAKAKYEGVFEKQDKIKLSASLLKACISKLQDIAILNKNTRIADEAFEFLLPDVAKAQEVMRWVWDNYLQDKPESKKIEYAQRYIYGLDFEEMMHKISRALMTIAGDGSSNIFRINTLDTKSWFEETEEKLDARKKLKKLLFEFNDYKADKENQETFRYFNFDILLTNPPFAGEIHDPSLIREYELTKNKKGGYPDKVERDLLFIERELQFIKPGGRMITVLPQGKLNNTNTEHIRKWLIDKARILAVVGLHPNTFKLPSPAKGTSTKTSLLFLQKWNNNPELGPLNRYQDDYPIFMAVSKKPGKNNSGEYVYKKDSKGQFIKDDGNLIVDSDLDEVAESFVKFAKEQKFSFWN